MDGMQRITWIKEGKSTTVVRFPGFHDDQTGKNKIKMKEELETMMEYTTTQTKNIFDFKFNFWRKSDSQNNIKLMNEEWPKSQLSVKSRC
jgi:hypothetical protein